MNKNCNISIFSTCFSQSSWNEASERQIKSDVFHKRKTFRRFPTLTWFKFKVLSINPMLKNLVLLLTHQSRQPCPLSYSLWSSFTGWFFFLHCSKHYSVLKLLHLLIIFPLVIFTPNVFRTIFLSWPWFLPKSRGFLDHLI